MRVPQATHIEMSAAASKGEYFNAHVRDKFAFIRNGNPLDSRRRAS